MAQKESLEKVLLKLLQKKGIQVSKIIVFGSFAKGEEKPESDMDIIVVSQDFRDKDIFERVALTRGIHRELVRRFMLPFDIVYYSDREWKQGRSLMINAAKEEGVVIYG